MVCKRSTTIEFENRPDMTNALNDLGIKTRFMKFDKIFFDSFGSIDQRTAQRLQKHGIPTYESQEWYNTTTYQTNENMREYFSLPETVSIEIWSYRFEVITYDLSKFEHRKIVNKVYKPIKNLGYEVSHNCETETKTSDTCGGR